MSLPSTSLLTSMVFSCVVGVGSVITCSLANACGTACAIMKGAGNMHPLCNSLILRLGTGPSTCHVHTVTLA